MNMKTRSVFSCLLVSALSILSVRAADQLEGRAVLPAATFAQGPTSGQQLGANPINGQPLPFLNKQPVQGFSAVQDNGDGTFNVMPDNGFGALENSADFHLSASITSARTSKRRMVARVRSPCSVFSSCMIRIAGFRSRSRSNLRTSAS
jgi:hypothetical protein